jgi:hypothetical protein
MSLRILVLALAVCTVVAFGQPIGGFGSIIPGAAILNPGVLQDAYQVNYLPNVTLNNGGWVNISNAGELGADQFGPGSGGNTGRICVSVFAFSADEQEVACCNCLVTPNNLVHLNALTDILATTLTGVTPQSITVKLLATIPGTSTTSPLGNATQTAFNGTVCTAASNTGITTANLAPGLVAWAVQVHSFPAAGGSPAFTAGTQSDFVPKLLSPGELASITTRCAGIVGNGSGAGLCKACTLQGLGGAKK